MTCTTRDDDRHDYSTTNDIVHVQCIEHNIMRYDALGAGAGTIIMELRAYLQATPLHYRLRDVRQLYLNVFTCELLNGTRAHVIT